jgi:hypothetical protein
MQIISDFMNEIINFFIILIHLQSLQTINKYNSIILKFQFPYILHQNIQTPFISQHLVKQPLIILPFTNPLLHIQNPDSIFLFLMYFLPDLEIYNKFVLVGLLQVVVQRVFEKGGDGRAEARSTRDVK